MRVHELNQNIEQLNEFSMTVVKKGTDAVVTGVKDTLKSAAKVAKDEFNDNVSAFNIIKKKFKGHHTTEEEFKNALEQLFKDNAKLLAVAGIGALPGSVVTLPIAIKVAKKLGIDLIPSKTFH